MEDCKSITTHAGCHALLSDIPDDSEHTDTLQVPYKELVGCLMFASMLTRPGITTPLILLRDSVLVPVKYIGQLANASCVIFKLHLNLVFLMGYLHIRIS